MKKVALFLLLLIILAITSFYICSCGKSTPQGSKMGKLMNYPEVKLESSVEAGTVLLPDIPEIRWDFYQEEGKTEMTCKFRMRVNYKEEGKFNAKVQFLDLNNFPVATEKIKLIGRKDEQSTYEQALYIDPNASRRISKVQILLTPIR